MAELQAREAREFPKLDADGEPITRQVRGKPEGTTEPVLEYREEWHPIGEARQDSHRYRVGLFHGGLVLWNKHAAAGHLSQIEDGELVVQVASVANSVDLRLVE